MHISWNVSGKKRKRFRLKAGLALKQEDGWLGRGTEGQLCTEEFYLAEAGDVLRLAAGGYEFAVATYLPGAGPQYLHTYAYAPDEAWVLYQHDLGEWWQNEYIFAGRCYFRVMLRRIDGREPTWQEQAEAGEILEFAASAQKLSGNVFVREVQQVAERVNRARGEKSLIVLALTDTHATVAGTWPDTVANVRALAEQIQPDLLVHLGDLTDGVVSKELTTKYVRAMLQEMSQLQRPVHVVLGNHDANYFQGNPQPFSLSEQVQLYQAQAEPFKSKKRSAYYATDYPEQKLKLIFLSAYDNNARPRYGYDLKQIEWLRGEMGRCAADWQIIIFSHDAPLAKLDFWSETLRHEAEIMAVLDGQQKAKGNILAFIHGHTHADYIYKGGLFPVVSIGCAKCEDMTEKKPPDAVTPQRELGTVTQELFEVLVVNSAAKKIDFIRFGAGADRQITKEVRQ